MKLPETVEKSLVLSSRPRRKSFALVSLKTIGLKIGEDAKSNAILERKLILGSLERMVDPFQQTSIEMQRFFNVLQYNIIDFRQKTMVSESKKKHVSLQKCRKLISLVFQQKKSIAKAARKLGIKPSASKLIIKNYRQTGQFFTENPKRDDGAAEESLPESIQRRSSEDREEQKTVKIEDFVEIQQYYPAYDPLYIYWMPFQGLPGYSFQGLRPFN